jgi:hypothetical protein
MINAKVLDNKGASICLARQPGVMRAERRILRAETHALRGMVGR